MSASIIPAPTDQLGHWLTQDIANYTSAPDSADAYINAFLLASLGAFGVEIALNVAFRPRNKWFPVS